MIYRLTTFVGSNVDELRLIYRDCQTQFENKLGVFVLYLRLLLEIFIMLYGLQFDQSSEIESSQGLCQAEAICMLTLESWRFLVLDEVSFCVRSLPNRSRNQARS